MATEWKPTWTPGALDAGLTEWLAKFDAGKRGECDHCYEPATMHLCAGCFDDALDEVKDLTSPSR